MVVSARPVTTLETLLGQIAIELQLPPYLDESVRTHYAALAAYLATSKRLESYSPAFYAQGSFRIGTTVKPVGSEEFDLDFICELQITPHGDPRVVFDLIAEVIESSVRYGPMSERMPRCIRVTFANNCHIDIVPAIPDPALGGTAILIPDHSPTGWMWRSTDPKGYVRWFDALHAAARLYKATATVEPLPPARSADEKSALQVGVQLLKRNHQIVVQDSKLRTPSIVLTTISGLGAARQDGIVETFDAGVRTVLSYAATPRHVFHPANPNEIISEKWNDADVFARFRAYSETFSVQWTRVKAAQGYGYSVMGPLLFEMFGENPVRTALKSLAEKTRALTDAGRIATGVGGSLGIITAGRANPGKTFYGCDLSRKD